MMFRGKQRDEQNKAAAYLRRICDLTSPNLPRFDDLRGEHRQNRTIPVLLTPWEDDLALVAESVTALTKDISDRGLSLTLPAPFRAEHVVAGFWVPGVSDGGQPRFLLGTTRQNVPIGGGFWALGIETLRLLNSAEAEPLLAVAQSRLQTQPIEQMALSAMMSE